MYVQFLLRYRQCVHEVWYLYPPYDAIIMYTSLLEVRFSHHKAYEL